MAIFTPAQAAALKAVLAAPPYQGQSAAQQLALLNAATTAPNPAPQGTVPRPFNLASIVAACSQAGRPGLGPFITAATPLILAQDAPALADGLDGLALLGSISAADAAAIKAALAATQPDPNWPARVPGPTPFQSLFPGVPFVEPGGWTHAGTCTQDMLAEVLGS